MSAGAISEVNFLDKVSFRTVRPTDIPSCFAIEKASYPEDEAASKASLEYRQHQAAGLFRCAILTDTGKKEDEKLIGFICSTRCSIFTAQSMSKHVPTGSLVAIHSVAVHPDYRRKGIASAMLKDYVKSVEKIQKSAEDKPRMEKLVCIAKSHLLAFYVKLGFQVTRPSPIIHGVQQWYELQYELCAGLDQKGCPCYIVDAFADPNKPGTGNPAAVVILDDSSMNSKWMQKVAAEFNLSETAFIRPKQPIAIKVREDSDDAGGEVRSDELHQLHYNISFFTPTCEVPLCGHATLASAAVLYQTIKLNNTGTPEIVFHAAEDILRTNLSSSTSARQRQTNITMEFPAKPAKILNDPAEEAAVQSMMAMALQVSRTDILFMGLSEIGDLLVELTYDAFKNIGYDGLQIDAFLAWDGYSRGVIVCCLQGGEPQVKTLKEGENNDKDTFSSLEKEENCGGNQIDFLSRFFGPKAGINEDPVTGSAHCVLAPYFCEKLRRKDNNLIGKQMSKRGGIVKCAVVTRGDEKSVKLTGSAVTAMDGTLWL